MNDHIENLNKWTLLHRYYGLIVSFEICYKVTKLGNCYTITLSNKAKSSSSLATGLLFDNQKEIDEYLEELKQKLINVAEADANLDNFI